MRNFFFTPLFFVLCFGSASMSIASVLGGHTTSRLQQDICITPPPDSLQITKIGLNFISLGWKPVLLGADHAVAVFIQNSTGNWDSLYTADSGPSAFFTVNNLDPGRKYRFKVATKCSTNESSQLTAVIDGITLIIELTMGGRIPDQPKLADDCTGIGYSPKSGNKWVGFRVSYNREGQIVSNIFEFEKTKNDLQGVNLRIKRVYNDNNPLVAANEHDVWPDGNFPNVQCFEPIRMGEIDDNGVSLDYFGRVQISLDNLVSSVYMCRDNNVPWDDTYLFEALVASDVIIQNPGGSQGRLEHSTKDKIKAQNPFNGNLKIFLPEDIIVKGQLTVSLINSNGQIVIEENIEAPSEQISIPVGLIPTGFYLLRIEVDTEVQNFKLIKW